MQNNFSTIIILSSLLLFSSAVISQYRIEIYLKNDSIISYENAIDYNIKERYTDNPIFRVNISKDDKIDFETKNIIRIKINDYNYRLLGTLEIQMVSSVVYEDNFQLYRTADRGFYPTFIILAFFENRQYYFAKNNYSPLIPFGKKHLLSAYEDDVVFPKLKEFCEKYWVRSKRKGEFRIKSIFDKKNTNPKEG